MSESHNVMGLFYKKLLYDHTLRQWQEDAYFLIATLYPFEKQAKQTPDSSDAEPTQRPKNFGASLGQIRRRLASNKEGVAGLDNRFERLLDADEQQLSFYLRREVQFLTNADGRIDWANLLNDLLKWHYPSRYVQRHWARAYFTTQPQQPENEFSG